MNARGSRRKNVVLVACSLCALTLIASGMAAAEPEVVSLKKLNVDPSMFEGKVVLVRAEVSGTVIDAKAYDEDAGTLKVAVAVGADASKYAPLAWSEQTNTP